MTEPTWQFALATRQYYDRKTVADAVEDARDMIGEWDYATDPHGYCHQRSTLMRLVEAAEQTLAGGNDENPTEDGQGLLTADEHEAVDLLGRLVHLLTDIVGPDMTRRADMTEAYYHVHALQNMILAQAAARAYPDRYRLLGRTVSDGAAAALSEPPVWAQATVRAMQTELEHLARVRGERT